MRIPDALVPLAELGVIDEVVRPLMSGKEAQVFLVSAGGELRVAKVYKESNERSFQNRADYTEGRRTRNTRDQRAMEKRSRFGRDKVEAAWRTAEVDAIYRLTAAGVRVPRPFDYVEGVLVMELISDESGNPAPRLCDVSFTSDEADTIFSQLIGDVVRMLCAGLIHGDLSDFNVLMGRDGPVLIDFPQAIDPAHNRNARKLLVRDVDNLTRFLGRFAPHLTGRPFGAEMWDLYERGQLQPDSVLTGHFKGATKKADTWSLLAEIEELERESLARREALGLGPPRKARKPIEVVAEPPPPNRGGRDGGGGRRGPGGPAQGSGQGPAAHRDGQGGRERHPSRDGQGGRERPPLRDGQGGRERQPGRDPQPGRDGHSASGGQSGRDGQSGWDNRDGQRVQTGWDNRDGQRVQTGWDNRDGQRKQGPAPARDARPPREPQHDALRPASAPDGGAPGGEPSARRRRRRRRKPGADGGPGST